jgi:hypothetical protein
VTEIDFADETTMERFFHSIAEPGVSQRISKDEAMLFDTDRIRSFRVDREEVSEL